MTPVEKGGRLENERVASPKFYPFIIILEVDWFDKLREALCSLFVCFGSFSGKAYRNGLSHNEVTVYVTKMCIISV